MTHGSALRVAVSNWDRRDDAFRNSPTSSSTAYCSLRRTPVVAHTKVIDCDAVQLSDTEKTCVFDADVSQYSQSHADCPNPLLKISCLTVGVNTKLRNISTVQTGVDSCGRVCNQRH